MHFSKSAKIKLQLWAKSSRTNTHFLTVYMFNIFNSDIIFDVVASCGDGI